MSAMSVLFSIGICVISAIIALLMGSVIPGIERKVQARIQQRIGPPILTPGFWSWLKFYYKKKVRPLATAPSFYIWTVVLGIFVVLLLLIVTLPPVWGFLGLASILGVVGFLKLEELLYVLMGSVSQSIMSVPLFPWDIVRGGKVLGTRREFFEQQSALRALKMIGLGSIPLYVAIAVPFAMAKSPYISDVIRLQNPAFFTESIFPLPSSPAFFTVYGFFASIVFFIGYVILLNDKPFNIIKPKIDIMEGGTLEYGAIYRAYMYIFSQVMAFVLSSVYVTLFLGIPLDVTRPALLALHLVLTLPLPIFKAVLAAFSPVLTFRQIYSASAGLTAIGAFALIASLII